MKKNYALAIAIIATCFNLNAQTIPASLWQETAKPASPEMVERTWLPLDYRYMHLDVTAMKAALSGAPDELNTQVKNSKFVLELPMPDGTLQHFKLVYAPFMHRDLAAVYPEIRTFTGQSIEDVTATIKCDITQFGFHAYVLASNYTVYIDPVNLKDINDYVIYYKHNSGRIPSFTCGVEDELAVNDPLSLQKNGGNPSVQRTIGGTLRTYRLALACTGEYSAVFGSTVANSLAAMNTSMNRVNGVYEKELCIHLTMVPNDTLLIFLDPVTDGYTNNDGSVMLGQNQQKCVVILGSANFDMGHVFSTGGGGIAQLGCICSSSSKAKGVTGLPNPVGDPFDIDYVAHEMGHQFGGNHTFNCETGSCQGNRAFSAAYEPGSGITIMAYAGICGNSDNLAQHSIPTFNVKSFDEIIVFSQNGGGNTCAVQTITGNNPPTITTQSNYNIPYKTPFRLVGSGVDPDGDTLTYSWEEYDLGPAGSWNVPTGTAPLFQPYNPTLTGTRLCPRLNNILNAVVNGNVQSRGNWMPDTGRVVKFRLTARDNKAGGGGVTNNDINALVQVTAINTSSNGFRVTSPNTTGINWPALSWQTITWAVGGSDANNINCANVNIWLSTDGGQTFPYLQALQVPNTGSYSCVILDQQSTQCRFMIEGDGNVFFDINDKNFTISAVTAIAETELSKYVSVFPNPSNGIFGFALNNNKINGEVTIAVYDVTGRLVKTEIADIDSNNNVVSIDLSAATNGVYNAVIKSQSGVTSKRLMKQ